MNWIKNKIDRSWFCDICKDNVNYGKKGKGNHEKSDKHYDKKDEKTRLFIRSLVSLGGLVSIVGNDGKIIGQRNMRDVVKRATYEDSRGRIQEIAF